MKPIVWGLGHVGNQQPSPQHYGAAMQLDNCAFCGTWMTTEVLLERGFCDPCRASLQPDAGPYVPPTPEPDYDALAEYLESIEYEGWEWSAAQFMVDA